MNPLHRVMHQIHRLLLAQTTLHEIYEQICSMLVDEGKFIAVWISEFSHHESGHSISKIAATSAAGYQAKSSRFPHEEQFPLEHQTLLQAFESNEIQIVQDAAMDPRTRANHHQDWPHPFRSLVDVPVEVAGNVACVLSVFHAEPSYFGAEEVAMMEEVADLIAIAVKHCALEEERASHELQWRLSANIFESLDAIIVTDADGTIILVNNAFTRFTGYQREEVIGKNPRILQSGRQDKAFYQAMWQALLDQGHWEGEIWNRRKNGEIYPEWLSISAMRDGVGKATHFVAHFLDMSGMKEAESEIQRLAYYDPLTGLANRRRFFQAMKSNELGLQTDALAFLLFVDVDRFKQVNDSLGHAVGDRLLQMVARRLTDAAGQHSLVARLGGDEFVVLHGPVANTDPFVNLAQEFSEQVRAALCLPYEMEEHIVQTTASVGARVFAHGKHDWDELMKSADMAMYQAKRQGGNRIECYDSDLLTVTERAQAMSVALREAIHKKQIQLYIQGQFDQEGRLVGAEVLSRWKWQGQWIAPTEFITLAEQFDLTEEFDLHVISRAIDCLAQWNATETVLPKLSININSATLRGADFRQALESVMQETTAVPSQIVFEITESAFLEDSNTVLGNLDAIVAMGIGISLGNFGTSNSSLAHLEMIPMQEVKIDRTVIQDVLINPQVQAITEALLELCAWLAIPAVAEGVETNDQVVWLYQAKCPKFQGYHFMQPEPLDMFSAIRLRGPTASDESSLFLGPHF